jgi:uncharacterized protein GlcG (DUF336 family)
MMCAFAPMMAPAQNRPIDQPASPQSLPGDALPPFNMLGPDGKLVPMPKDFGAIHAPAGAGPESTAIGPNLDLSLRLVKAAVDACTRRGFAVGAAVIDTAGEARAMATADTSDGSHVFVAHRKALAALAFRMPTTEALKRVQAGEGLDKVTPAMFVNVGGVPIMRHGVLIGAIGVSGGRGVTTDEDCAHDALATVAAELR